MIIDLRSHASTHRITVKGQIVDCVESNKYLETVTKLTFE